jgi:hypothetical protein
MCQLSFCIIENEGDNRPNLMQQYIDQDRVGTLVLDANFPIFSAFKGIQSNKRI